jgi:hypothetical protein
VVHPSLPVKNVKELVALAKAHPGKLNFASPGVGTPNHLGIELLQVMAGVKFTHVPYKGGAPALIDLVAGQVQLFWSSTPQIVSFLKQGRCASSPPEPRRLRASRRSTRRSRRPTRVRLQYLVRIACPRGDAAGDRDAAQHRVEPRADRSRHGSAAARSGRRADAGHAGRAARRIVSETERWRKVIKAAGITAEYAQ